MKVGIMQPYFFPYIGYWQLIESVDKYVIYDDVNYIKSGWINRNRILVEGSVKYLNIQLIGASSYKKINEVFINNDNYVIGKTLRKLEAAYQKAPYYEKVYPVIKEIICYKERNLAYYLGNLLKKICEYLDISTIMLYSSSLGKNCELKGEEKILDICRLLEATEYYNAVGGQKLYLSDNFERMGINLKFIKANEIIYKQYENRFQPNLSIIDVLMFNSREKVKAMLTDYTLISHKEDKS